VEKNIKNQNIYACLSGEHMCVLECIYIALHLEQYKKIKGNVKDITWKLKKFHQEWFRYKIYKKNTFYQKLGS
jgi:hypothetical protein